MEIYVFRNLHDGTVTTSDNDLIDNNDDLKPGGQVIHVLVTQFESQYTQIIQKKVSI